MDLTIDAPDFELAKTLNSGQVFHWQANGGGYYGLIGDRPVFVRQEGSTLSAKVASAGGPWGKDHRRAVDATATIRHYFALDHKLTEICRSFPKDSIMDAAADYCRG